MNRPGIRTIVSISGRIQFNVRQPPPPQQQQQQQQPQLQNQQNQQQKYQQQYQQPQQRPRIATAQTNTGSRLAFRQRRENDTTISSSATGDAPLAISDQSRRRGKPITLIDNSSIAAGLTVRLLETRAIKNMTKNGKYARFSVLVAIGDGRGGLGVAHSKAVAAVDSIAKATRLAAHNMEYFERWQDRTLFHDDVIKYKATRLFLRPAAPESGRRCHPTISEMCRCMGIKDISAKVLGSRTPLNVAEAFLIALRRQRTPEQVAQDSGMKIVDVLKVYNQGCEELSRTLRAERYANSHLKLAGGT